MTADPSLPTCAVQHFVCNPRCCGLVLLTLSLSESDPYRNSLDGQWCGAKVSFAFDLGVSDRCHHANTPQFPFGQSRCRLTSGPSHFLTIPSSSQQEREHDGRATERSSLLTSSTNLGCCRRRALGIMSE